MDLGEYEALKFELAQLLRALRRHYARPGGGEPEALEDLFARLAEDRFCLTMAGRFSRGKTSLMNAILGTERLPVGIVPLTSVITLVSYGSEEKAVLHYHATSLIMDIPLSELGQYITERGNPGNRRGIRAAEVQLPAEFLRRGFTFVDTPGLGSAILANTKTTQSFLPEADALLLVTSHDSALSEEEMRVLTAAQAARQPLFVVLNKRDLVDEAGRAETLALLEARLRQMGPPPPIGVFSVSARAGLAAKLAGDGAALAASGLPALEAAVVDFLIHRRRQTFLTRISERLSPLLAVLPSEFSDRLNACRARIDTVSGGRFEAVPQVSFDPLLSGCEVCAAVAKAVFGFLFQYQAKLYAEAAAQEELARSGGFCRLHARGFESVAAAREAATGLAPVLLRQAKALRGIAAADLASALGSELVADLLPSGPACPACSVARQAERAKIQALASQVAAHGAAVVHRRSALCLPHLGRLVALLPSAASRALFMRQARLMERLAEDALRYALKQDAVRRDRASKEDLAAAERAARVLLEHPDAQYEPARAEVGKEKPPVGKRAEDRAPANTKRGGPA